MGNPHLRLVPRRRMAPVRARHCPAEIGAACMAVSTAAVPWAGLLRGFAVAVTGNGTAYRDRARAPGQTSGISSSAISKRTKTAAPIASAS